MARPSLASDSKVVNDKSSVNTLKVAFTRTFVFFDILVGEKKARTICDIYWRKVIGRWLVQRASDNVVFFCLNILSRWMYFLKLRVSKNTRFSVVIFPRILRGELKLDIFHRIAVLLDGGIPEGRVERLTIWQMPLVFRVDRRLQLNISIVFWSTAIKYLRIQM